MKKILIKIALAACALAGAFAAAGCRSGERKGDYDYLVTFNYNVGSLQEGAVEDCYLGVKENSLVVLQPGADARFPGRTVEGYYVGGWYLPATDASGNALVNEADGRVVWGEEWDFASDRVTKDLTLYAKLLPNSKLIIKGGDEDKTFDGSRYDGEMNKPDSTLTALLPRKEGYTFIDYYEDEAFTKKFEWPYVFEEAEKIVYAKFVQGDWAPVTTANEFVSAVSDNKKPIYLDNDIDFTGVAWVPGDFNFELNGNGHAVKNITYSRDGNRNGSNASPFALFNSVFDANIHDITFENAMLTFNVTMALNAGNFRAAPFATNANDKTVIANVKMTGSFTVTKRSEMIGVTVSAACANANVNTEGWGLNLNDLVVTEN